MPNELVASAETPPRRSFYDSTVGLPPIMVALPDHHPMAKKLNKALDKLEVLKEALDLVAELWPKPGYASVTLESHQWARLRQVLLSIPDLVANDE